MYVCYCTYVDKLKLFCITHWLTDWCYCMCVRERRDNDRTGTDDRHLMIAHLRGVQSRHAMLSRGTTMHKYTTLQLQLQLQCTVCTVLAGQGAVRRLGYSVTSFGCGGFLRATFPLLWAQRGPSNCMCMCSGPGPAKEWTSGRRPLSIAELSPFSPARSNSQMQHENAMHSAHTSGGSSTNTIIRFLHSTINKNLARPTFTIHRMIIVQLLLFDFYLTQVYIS